MEPTKTVEQQGIEDDQQRSHAVFFVDCPTTDEVKVEEEIENGLQCLQVRAQSAKMQMIGAPAILQNAYYHLGDEEGHVCLTVICAWMSQAAVEKMQLQERLGGGGLPPKPSNPMRRA